MKTTAIATLLTMLAGTAIAADKAQQAEPENHAFGQLPKNTGWLSDPDTPADTIWDAIGGGKLSLNDRLRFEYADQGSRKPSYAFTNRLRLGYTTKPWEGFNGMVEMENVASFDSSLYWVPATTDGDPARSVVADPQDTEINQAWLQYHRDNLFDSDFGLNVKAGRQRLTLDDHRFIGNVGWRQFEQTMDAARVDLSNGPLTFTYAHVWRVQRIFSDSNANNNWDANTHLLHLAWKAADWITVKPFYYYMNFDQSAANSNQTFGVRVDGKVPLGEEDSGLSLAYEGTYAHQTDEDTNPVNYDADFFAGDVSVSKKGLGALGVGYQFLGSDNGNMAFRFPLGTNHKFNGWADLFLTTPNNGLQDLYGYVKADLPWGLKGTVVYHQFWFDQNNTDIGHEIDAVLVKKISPNWVVLTKAAHFDGDAGYIDVTRFWLETTFKF
ncbi:MAG TPA: hypothetical protein ENK11_09580 [Phycisphaerales bacterium]|nr:hypothetical protein [Phycisphaerales bacterium]